MRFNETPFNLVISSIFAVLLCLPLYFSSTTVFPFVVLKAGLAHLCVLALFAMALYSAWRKASPLTLNWLTLLLIGFVLIQISAGIANSNFGQSFVSSYERSQGIWGLMCWVLLTMSAAVLLTTEKQWRLLLRGIVIIGTGISVLALSYATGLIEASYLYRDFGRLAFTVGNSAVFGNYLAVVAVLAFAVLLIDFGAVSRKVSTAQMIQFGIILSALIATGSRSGVLALAVTTAIVIALSDKGGRVKAYVGLASMLLLVVFTLLFWDLVTVRLAETTLTNQSVAYRLDAWQIGWRAFLENPILGWGPENFLEVFGRFANVGEISNETFDSAHNHLVAILVGSGLFGIATYLAILLCSVRALLRAGRAAEPETSSNALLIFAGILAYQIGALFLFDSIVTAPLFFIFLGYCVRHAAPIVLTALTARLPLCASLVFLMLTAVGYEISMLRSAIQLHTVKASKGWDIKTKMASSLSGKLRHDELMYIFAMESWSNWSDLSSAEKLKVKSTVEQLIGDAKILELDWRTLLHVSRVYLAMAQDGAKVDSELRLLVDRTVQLAPNRPQSHRLLANYFIVTNQPDRAVAVLTAYLAKDPDRPIMKKMLRGLTYVSEPA